jgi:hypothetical protein
LGLHVIGAVGAEKWRDGIYAGRKWSSGQTIKTDSIVR